MGDGAPVEHASAVEVFQCALKVQQAVAERQEDAADQVVGQRPRRFDAAQLAVDLLDLVVADDDREAAHAVALAQVDVLVIALLVDDDAREFDFDEIHGRGRQL